MPGEIGVSADVIGGAGPSAVVGAFSFGIGCCCGPNNFACGPTCSIPKKDLTVSWFNGVSGDGSTTLHFNNPNTWISSCTNQLLYQILCNAGQVEFRVIYFISGACPNGQSNYCSTLGGNPLRLVQTALTCGDTFLLTCNVTDASCPNLFENGYTGFSVSV